MASPLPTRKQSVDLGSTAPRVSKIRRDPPPPEKPKAIRHPDVVDRTAVIIGVLVFALSIFVIVLAFGSWSGWTPQQYTVEVNLSEELRHPDVVNRSAVAIGVLVFAVAIVVILIAFSIFTGLGWSPRNYTVHV